MLCPQYENRYLQKFEKEVCQQTVWFYLLWDPYLYSMVTVISSDMRISWTFAYWFSAHWRPSWQEPACRCSPLSSEMYPRTLSISQPSFKVGRKFDFSKLFKINESHSGEVIIETKSNMTFWCPDWNHIIINFSQSRFHLVSWFQSHSITFLPISIVCSRIDKSGHKPRVRKKRRECSSMTHKMNADFPERSLFVRSANNMSNPRWCRQYFWFSLEYPHSGLLIRVALNLEFNAR